MALSACPLVRYGVGVGAGVRVAVEVDVDVAGSSLVVAVGVAVLRLGVGVLMGGPPGLEVSPATYCSNSAESKLFV